MQINKIVAWQYRAVTKRVWDSCGEFTYNKYKDDLKYEVRRLCIYDVTLREDSKTDGFDFVGTPCINNEEK